MASLSNNCALKPVAFIPSEDLSSEESFYLSVIAAVDFAVSKKSAVVAYVPEEFKDVTKGLKDRASLLRGKVESFELKKSKAIKSYDAALNHSKFDGEIFKIALLFDARISIYAGEYALKNWGIVVPVREKSFFGGGVDFQREEPEDTYLSKSRVWEFPSAELCIFRMENSRYIPFEKDKSLFLKGY